MNKLDMQSQDIVNKNIENISKLFPNCVIEGKIDFEALRQELSRDLIDDKKEKYQLTWVGKQESIINANTPTNKTLIPVKEKSVDFDNTKNIYIEGDNLEVLKILQESYLNKIKCIYIDPPYNTGNDFIYNDSFAKESNEELEDSGQVDEYNNRLVTNNESNGRFHSDWLNMMYSRLKLSRNLLKDDGFIFISIDDNEQAVLKMICNEIFGEKNFIAQFMWKRKKEISNDSKNVAIQGEYIICYKKSNSGFLKFEPLSEEYIKKSYNEPNDKFPLGKWRPVPLTVSKGLTGGGYEYAIKTPSGIEYTRVWAYPEKSYKKLEESGLVYFGKNNDSVPQRVMYEMDSKGQPVSNYWDSIATNKEGKKEILDLFKDNIFDTPKPVKLLNRIFNLVIENGDIVLDFFSGSSTTAHSIMELNSVKYKELKYILIQVPEECDKKSEAYKDGYKTICDIGEERIRRASEKIKEETNADIDYGFRVYKIDSSNMKDVYYKPSELNQKQLNMFETNIKEDRNSEDLLTQVILDLGLTLDLKIEEKDILDNKVFFVDKNSLVACFDDNLNINIIDEICKYNPLKVVFRDSSFKTDNDKINVEERIKKLSPETEISIL